MWTYWVVWHVWAIMVVVCMRCTDYFILVSLSSSMVSRNYAFYVACMILDIALCWCWQCLLTVGWHLLPHTVTPLDIITVAWRCRQTQDVLQPAECPQGTLQSSEWQWTASVFTAWYCTGSCSSLFTADTNFQRYLTACYGCWTGVTDKCVRWYSASY